ncbi:hypothetical protein LOTGIDRAFT_226561 [Lottia gigantea]|uniref:Neurotransmitter-gated ion-channel ligand-binding domain-containing protein n=1 Tax=Lottia gigantea TaxID=225164 RepID=V4C9U2_LOTGI|nr:hypothetical protein LOTGIDRAFT_226561 [Lottia gigantea]ESO98539.1 hypothetical protein LOTGIDRAFT_226561 [Lottia gigantea]
MYIMCLSLVLIFLSCSGVKSFTIKNETSLREELFVTNEYDVNVRPLSRVTVQIKFNLLTIHELNIRDQVFRVSGWLTMVWLDKRLSWDKDKHGNVQFLFATQSEIWRPAMVVSNSIENVGVLADEFTPFRITTGGRIFWEPTGIFVVYCEVDITYYPFDTQECFITVQSWGYNLREVNVTALGEGIDIQEFKPNGEWQLTSFRVSTEDNIDSKGDSFSQIKFHFKLDRKSNYYWLNVLLPVLVNSILTALVFALPAESGEKMGYSLTVLLSFAVLLTLVADKIPSTSINTSLIVVYFAIVLVLGALAVALSTIVLEFYFRSDAEPIPKWVMFISKDIVGRMVCYKGINTSKNSRRVENGVEPKVDYNDDPPLDRATTIKREIFLRKASEIYRDRMNCELRWRDISKIWDVFFLRLYLLVITCVTLGFLIGTAGRA